MKIKNIKYGAILIILSIGLIGCSNVTNTQEYKELQSKYEELEKELADIESQLETKDKLIKTKDNIIKTKEKEIESLKSSDEEEVSTGNKYIDKYGVDVSNRKPFNETTISNLDLITNNGKDKLTKLEQECYFNNWNTVMLDKNNVWHFDEHCNKITGNLNLISLSHVDLSKSDNCYKCGW